MGKSIVVTSGKGGTGKTSFVSAVSSCLATLGKKVICIDADIGLRNLDVALGLSEKTAMDFNDVLLARCSIRDALIEHPVIKNLSILPSPTSIDPHLINEYEFNKLVSALAEQVDFVFVDCPAGIDAGFRLAVNSCQEAFLVVTPDAMALRDGARAASEIQQPAKLIVNRVRPHLIYRRLAQNIDDAIDITGLPLFGLIPEDEMVIAAANNYTPLILLSHNGAARAYLNVAKRMLGEDIPLNKMKFWRIGQ